jgi:hypothetical protein
MGRFHRPVKATKCVLMQPTAVTSLTPHSEQLERALRVAGESARTDSKQAPGSIDGTMHGPVEQLPRRSVFGPHFGHGIVFLFFI